MEWVALAIRKIKTKALVESFEYACVCCDVATLWRGRSRRTWDCWFGVFQVVKYGLEIPDWNASISQSLSLTFLFHLASLFPAYRQVRTGQKRNPRTKFLNESSMDFSLARSGWYWQHCQSDAVELYRCLNIIRCNKQQLEEARMNEQRLEKLKIRNTGVSLPRGFRVRGSGWSDPRGRTARIPHARGWLIDIT